MFLQKVYSWKKIDQYKISILTKEEDLNKFIELLLTETSTFGVRYKQYNRAKLDRKFIDLNTNYGIVKIKLGYYNRKLIKAKPEYEQCKLISTKLNIPITEVYNKINMSLEKEISKILLT